MGTIKEYVDRAVQAGGDLSGLLHADPAIVLVATSATRSRLIQADSSATSLESGASLSPPYCLNLENAYTPSLVQGCPTSPICAPLISRKLAKRKRALQGVRQGVSDMIDRRIFSMPENKGKGPATRNNDTSGRVVSMPERVKPVLESSTEFFPSPSTGNSYGSYDVRRERVHVSRVPSDVPQTPSPPSSPDSLLIIDCGAQFPDTFLRRKYASETLHEVDEDWVAWANSPPRPIPALHGPLSLPYARCPSGAEGTIIEEPDNVSRMIWGLGPNDQLPNQPRVDSVPPSPDIATTSASQVQAQVPPRLQKKRTIAAFQVGGQSRTPLPPSKSYVKPTRLARLQERPYSVAEREPTLGSQSAPVTSMQQNVISGLACTEAFTPSTTTQGSDYNAHANNISAEESRFLDWQLALLRQALKSSSVDRDAYSHYSDGLEPVIPPNSVGNFPPPLPRIFVEPRTNETVSSAGRQSAVEIAQQYRQRQLFQQALQNQKLQQSVLPTPPSSSSSLWSSHFSPYHGSSLSPDVAVSPDLPSSVSSQSYRLGADSSQQLRRFVHEHQDAFNLARGLDMHGISSGQSPEFYPTVKDMRQDISSSSTLAKYLQQLHALSQNTPQNPGPPPSVPVPPIPSLQSGPRGVPGYHQGRRQSVPMPTPLSPESPPPRARALGLSYQHPRSVPLARLMQRRLSSVPEEDSTIIEHLSPPKLQSNTEHQRGVSAHVGMEAAKHLEIPAPQANRPRTPTPTSLGEYEVSLPIFHHSTSPAKVRLPVVKEHEIVAHESLGGHHARTRGENNHKKKFRNKKSKWPAGTTAKPQPRGLVG